MALTLEIVTPEARVFSDTIDTVVIPTVDGEIGILPGHIPLLTQVQDGELRVTKGTVVSFLAVGGGFAQVSGDKVSILAERAITEDKIDEKAVENAMQRAEQAIKDAKDMDPAEFEHLQSMVRFSGTQLALKRRRRRTVRRVGIRAVSLLLFFHLQRHHQLQGVLAAQGSLNSVDDELRFGHAQALGSLRQLLFQQGVHANRNGHGNALKYGITV